MKNEWMNEWSCNYSAGIDWVVVATVNTERKTQSSGALSFCYCWFQHPLWIKIVATVSFGVRIALPAAVHAFVLEASEKRTRGCIYTWQWKMNDGCIKLAKQRKLTAAVERAKLLQHVWNSLKPQRWVCMDANVVSFTVKRLGVSLWFP